MAVDVSRFHQTFFEESDDNLDLMESCLLALDPSAVDLESIHTIFRAAHSIKGGAGTFGFAAAAQFTHNVEALLEDLRSEKRQVTQQIVSTLLKSVDSIRAILRATRSGDSFDAQAIAEVEAELGRMLTGGNASSSSTAPSATETKAAGWNIRFEPFEHMLRTGNDPLRLLSSLSELGETSVKANLDALPEFDSYDPENCYLSWDVALRGETERTAIEDIFDWVRDDSVLSIHPILESEQAAATTESQAAGPASSAVRVPRAETGSIRVSTDKVDAIINLVGELVITQSMLSGFSDYFDMSMLDKLRDGLSQLARNTRELQENVLKIRMLPISSAFNRFPRLVHEMSQRLGKKVELKISGEQTELDKTVMEKITDPLVHLVRNSLDHGLEMPNVRREQGKRETGLIHLAASQEGGNILIQVSDDGAGLNAERILAKARERGLVGQDEHLAEQQIHELIFLPGFSTAETVSDLSGRGVGMDVVLRNIKELGGSIETRSSAGKGSSFSIRLPLTLAIMDGQLLQVGDQTFIIPLVSIVESLQVRAGQIFTLAGGRETYRFRDEYIPVVRLHEVFSVEARNTKLAGGLLVVVEAESRLAGILIDDLLGQQQVVVKSLETNFRRVDGISGATILGNGTVSMILDIPAILRLHCG